MEDPHLGRTTLIFLLLLLIFSKFSLNIKNVFSCAWLNNLLQKRQLYTPAVASPPRLITWTFLIGHQRIHQGPAFINKRHIGRSTHRHRSRRQLVIVIIVII